MIVRAHFLGTDCRDADAIQQQQHSVPAVRSQRPAKSVLGALPVRQCILQSLPALFGEAVDAFAMPIAPPELKVAFPSQSAKAAGECFYGDSVIARELALRNLAGFVYSVQGNELRRLELRRREHEIIQLGDRTTGRS